MFLGLGGAGAPGAGAPTSSDEARAPRCVLVTGANRGLGLEFARQYRAAGWNVIGTTRKPAAADELRATGAEVMQLDVTDAESIAKLARELAGRPIDLLINNAGVGSRTPTIEGLDAKSAERVLAVNLLGPMRVTSALLPNVRAGAGKQIVAISSGLGSIADNTSGRWYGYRESKAGLNMFMRSLAAELRGEGFVCVVLSPGWVRTDMGGPEAPLSPKQSITGMRRVIDGLDAEKSGHFYGHDGAEIPW
ncbi:MAG: SDR family oxidoreductase [Planctomycetes bacterium]|nr:SDR family oxidoreductase [Planctomycetota bacterium]